MPRGSGTVRSIAEYAPDLVFLDVREMLPWFRGEQILVLKGGTQLSVGRAFRNKFLQQIGNAVS